MPISLTVPLQRAWARMERMLFRPFRLRTWFVLGFAAFLSEFLSGGTANHYGWHGRGEHWSHAAFAERVHDFFSEPAMIVLALVAAAVAVIVAIALQWVSCRGRFVFLDDVVHERPAIVDPWHKYARLGDSLFIWTLLFWLVVIMLVVIVSLPFLASLRSLWDENTFTWTALLSIAGLVALVLPLGIVIAYTVLFLNHFVVPMMYRHGLSATAAWSRFLTLFRAQPWWFLGYGVMVFVIWVAISTLVVIVGVSTCCVGFIVFSFPYLGQVALLPALALLRAFGPEFLAQFGAEHDVFAAGRQA